jgi:hypothetical protein
MHVLRPGDEIQAAGAKQPWVIGTFVSYENGLLTLDGVVPLYGNRGRVYESTPTVTFAPQSIFIYGEGEAPIFTWNAGHGPLERFLTIE